MGIKNSPQKPQSPRAGAGASLAVTAPGQGRWTAHVWVPRLGVPQPGADQPQPWGQSPGGRLGELVTRTGWAVGPAAPTQDGQSLLQAAEHPCSPSVTRFGGLSPMDTSPCTGAVAGPSLVGNTPCPWGTQSLCSNGV